MSGTTWIRDKIGRVVAKAEAMLGLFALTPSLPVPVPTSETAQPLLSSDLPALHSRNIQAGQFAPGEPVPVYRYSQGHLSLTWMGDG